MKVTASNNIKKINKKGKVFLVNTSNNSYKRFWDEVENNSWEPNIYKIFDKFIDKDHSYIDIGAWIGPTVLYGCQIAKHAYAIEPDPIAYKELQINVNLNPNLIDKITLYNGCIGNRCGKVKFGNRRKGGDSISSILFSDCEISWIVRSITLDKFIEINNVQNCNFIKMDIEGGESIVLPNIKNYLQKNKPTLHLSLHPPFLKNINKDLKKIIDVLKIYKNIFDINGKKINLNYILSNTRFRSIVATDKKWN